MEKLDLLRELLENQREALRTMCDLVEHKSSALVSRDIDSLLETIEVERILRKKIKRLSAEWREVADTWAEENEFSPGGFTFGKLVQTLDKNRRESFLKIRFSLLALLERLEHKGNRIEDQLEEALEDRRFRIDLFSVLNSRI